MTADSAPPDVDRVAFATSDPFEARTFMDRTYGGQLRVATRRDTDWKLSVDQIAASGIVSGDVRLPADLTFEVDGHDELVINTVLSGAVEYEHEQLDRCLPGNVYVGNHPDLHCVCRTHTLHAHTLTLSRSLVNDVAVQAGARPGQWRITSLLPVDGGARRWREAIRFIDGLLADRDAATAPLIIGPAARLLAGTALSVFPNTALSQAPSRDRRDAHPETLRRAISFIDANPNLDITIADIARAAHVTPRAVQLAFRRHLNTTPTAYLRHTRLQHAHQELLDAEPSALTTVTRVAIDWGFANPSRFAAHYRAAYGQTPSETLKR